MTEDGIRFYAELISEEAELLVFLLRYDVSFNPETGSEIQTMYLEQRWGAALAPMEIGVPLELSMAMG